MDSTKNIYPFPNSKRERKKIRNAKINPRKRLLHRLGSFCRVCFILLLTAFMLIHYSLLSLDSVQRIASYIRIGTTSSSGDMHTITFPDIADTALPSGNGLVIAGKGDLSVCMPGSITQLKLALSYSDMAVDASSQYILVYNKNGTELTLANSAAELGTLKLNSPILSVCMGESNQFAVITDESGYRTAVTVYNDKRKQMYKWSSSEYYIMSASLSDDGKRMAVVCFTQDGADIISRLLFFNLDSNQIQKTVELGDSIPLHVDFLSDNTVAALCHNSLSIINRKGKILGQKTFTSSDFLTYDTAKNQVVLGLKSYTKSARSDLYILKSNGKISKPLALQDDLRNVSLNNNRLAVMTSDTITIYDNNQNEIYHYDDAISAKDIILKDDGSFYLVYAKYALILSRSDGTENFSGLLPLLSQK